MSNVRFHITESIKTQALLVTFALFLWGFKQYLK